MAEPDKELTNKEAFREWAATIHWDRVFIVGVFLIIYLAGMSDKNTQMKQQVKEAREQTALAFQTEAVKHGCAIGDFDAIKPETFKWK